MPKLALTAVPSYRLHKQSGQAIVTLSGRDVLLGTYGTKLSREQYARITGEWLAAGRQLPAEKSEVTVAEVAAAFRRHAKTYYCDADGNVGKAVVNLDEALRSVLKLYAKTPAAKFGPLALKACRDDMIRAGRVRKNINRLVSRIRSVFKWATENEMIDPRVYHGLLAVGGLKSGRCGAKESDPVKPVPIEHVEAVLPHLSRQVRAMVELQILTGMRPGEVVLLRGCDLDTTGKLWTFKPAKHKGQVHERDRVVYLGPKAQEIIEPFLRLNPQEYLFDPRDAERERREKLTAARKTPQSCGNKPGTNRRRKPSRQPGDRYTTMSYYRAVIRACDVAFLAPDGTEGDALEQWRREHRWHVHQLRHRAATDLRKQYGVEVAQVMLGHTRIETAQIYAERNSALAQRVAMEVG